MKQNEQIKISLRKTNMIRPLIYVSIFIALGLDLIFNFSFSNTTISHTIIITLGLFSLIIFVGIAIILLKHLLDNKSGLIISKRGIVDNSSLLSIGFISWSDISDIKISNINNQKSVIFIFNNPQDYIKSVSNKLKRKVMEMNYKDTGYPISITTRSLKTSYRNLQELLTTQMNNYKS